MGKLERKLDEDLIDRMAAGWTPTARTKPIKRKKLPRSGSSFRGARRNAAKGLVWAGCLNAKYLEPPPVRLNRSRKWDGVPLTKPYR